MAEQRIAGKDGSTTVISDSYGFGSVQVGPPIRPEPPRVESPWIDKPRLLKKLGFTEEDFVEAQQYEFPIAAKRPQIGGWAITLVWRESQIDEWVDRMRASIAARQRLIRSVR
jgi:hypothetical protein